MTGTEHHCDTCTCTPPVPDLNAALRAAAAALDVRGAYSVRIDLDGHITLLAKFVTTETLPTWPTRNGLNYNEFKCTVFGFPVRIVAVDHEPAVTA